MRRLVGRWIAVPLLALICGAGWGRAVQAQMPTQIQTQSSLGRGSPTAGVNANAAAPGFYGNPYAVPAMNPFLNPYASLYAPATPQNAALYFFAAQQSMGGLGSGQMSGTRPGPARAAAAPARSPIPEDRRVSDTPGGGAARYFNRSVPGGSIPENRYNRYGKYYSANGH
jgi:hypothetical protein